MNQLTCFIMAQNCIDIFAWSFYLFPSLSLIIIYFYIVRLYGVNVEYVSRWFLAFYTLFITSLVNSFILRIFSFPFLFTVDIFQESFTLHFRAFLEKSTYFLSHIWERLTIFEQICWTSAIQTFWLGSVKMCTASGAWSEVLWWFVSIFSPLADFLFVVNSTQYILYVVLNICRRIVLSFSFSSWLKPSRKQYQAVKNIFCHVFVIYCGSDFWMHFTFMIAPCRQLPNFSRPTGLLTLVLRI